MRARFSVAMTGGALGSKAAASDLESFIEFKAIGVGALRF